LWRDIVILFQTFTAVIRNTFEPSGETGRFEAAPVLRIHRVEEHVRDESETMQSATPGAKEASSIG
jgi:hypothetical protein